MVFASSKNARCARTCATKCKSMLHLSSKATKEGARRRHRLSIDLEDWHNIIHDLGTALEQILKTNWSVYLISLQN